MQYPPKDLVIIRHFPLQIAYSSFSLILKLEFLLLFLLILFSFRLSLFSYLKFLLLVFLFESLFRAISRLLKIDFWSELFQVTCVCECFGVVKIHGAFNCMQELVVLHKQLAPLSDFLCGML